MKLIHHLSAGPYPRCEPDEALEELFTWRGLEQTGEIEARLEILRMLQNGTDYLSPSCQTPRFRGILFRFDPVIPSCITPL